MSSDHVAQARTFLAALLAGAPPEPDRYFHLWDLATKRTTSFRVADPHAIERATTWSQAPTDLYVSVAMGQVELPAHQRLKNDGAAGLFGPFSDIDVAGPAHQKVNLPPSLDAAVDLLDEFGVPPTEVVSSGHGLQAWWLFPEPWILHGAEDRAEAATLAKGWVTAYRAVAARHGWDLDSVGDLARLLRVPGTINGKVPDQPAPVELLFTGGPRYSREQLADAIARIDAGAPRRLLALPPGGTSDPQLRIDPDAEPPPEKLQRLLQHPGAVGSWNYDRSDFQDQSPSSFDMSLAALAVLEHWEDQEIVDLLIAVRRRNGATPKLRPDYFARTLHRARLTLDGDDEDNEAEEGPPTLHGRIGHEGLEATLAGIMEDTEHFAQRGGQILRYDQGRYAEAKPWVHREIRWILEDGKATNKWTAKATGDVLSYIAAYAPPLWETPPPDRLNLRNGLLDLETLELLPHTPSHLSSVQLPLVFDPAATCPAIDSFVRDTFPDDALDVAFELLALAMVPDRSIQKLVLLVGPGGNGKSVFLRLVKRFVGMDNCATEPLHRLEDNRFAASRLVGKLVNICADLPATDLRSTSMLKGITGGDTITVERKYRDPYDADPYCKLIFSANTPPRSPDASDGFFQRFLVVPFSRSFRGEPGEVPSWKLGQRLHAQQELSGALNGALVALQRIRSAGLSEPLSCVLAREEFRAATDPVCVWLDRETLTAPGAFVPKRRLWEEYNADAIREGTSTIALIALGRALRRSRPGIRDGQRIVAGVQREVWLDLTLRRDRVPAGESGASGAFGTSPSQSGFAAGE